MPAFLFPFPFGPSAFSGGSPGWTAVSAVAETWNAFSNSVLRSWADMTLNTYDSTFDIGANLTITANEEFPMYAVEDRPLIVPPDSGYSQP